MAQIRRVAIVGVTGFVGHGLPALLAENGISTTGISRSGRGDIPHVDRWQTPETLDFSGHDAVINLAGEPIDRRWTEANRRIFHDSRVGVTTRVVEAIARLPDAARPKVLVNGSAVGIYGDRGEEVLPDTARPGQGYLAGLCTDWEDAARDAGTLGLRVIRLRIGVVLGKDGAAFEKLRKVVKSGLGGPLGSGKQWMPWIHLADLRSIILHSLLSEGISGPVNGSAPNPERNRDLIRKLAATLHRPAIIPAPAFALKLVLGEFSSALLASQKAVPAALIAAGFRFRYPTLEDALRQLLV